VAATVEAVDPMSGKPRNERRRVEPRPRVGDLTAGGEAATGAKGAKVWVNAYTGIGVTVLLDPDEAEAFGLAVLLAARDARASRPPE
jgi:hypothetical protein